VLPLPPQPNPCSTAVACGRLSAGGRPLSPANTPTPSPQPWPSNQQSVASTPSWWAVAGFTDFAAPPDRGITLLMAVGGLVAGPRATAV
jgi:hypothetical protein